jgi:hypothetical protein
MPEQLMSTISQLKGRKISHNISPCRSCLLVALLLLQLLHTLKKKTALQHSNTTRGRFQDTVNRATLLLRTPASYPSVYSEQIAVQMADGEPRHLHLAGRAEQRKRRAEEETKQQP